MAPGESAPLSLRPFPVSDKKPKNIAEFVARVSAQPGGFRSLNSAELRDDAAAKETSGADDAMEVDEADVSEDDEDDEAETDPAKVRQEILTSLE